ncbi:MAG: hypothetical protein P8Y53_03615 [Pseudolabrys sp.]|jgi:molecular chaperone GrpE (heat shock protein)
MASIHQLITDVERRGDAHPEHPRFAGKIDVPEEVLRFAPRKIRAQHETSEDRIEQLENEVKEWQDRAGRAEARLRSIEESVQRIAAKYLHAAPKTASKG